MSIFQKKSSSMEPGDVFISYRHINIDLVKPIVEELKRRDISYFVDWKNIDYGEDYPQIISRAISVCKVLLLVWTKDVQDSKDIASEVGIAIGLQKKIFPYRIGDFNIYEHGSLIYPLVNKSRYEVPRQTPETIREIVNRVELELTGKITHLPPVSVSSAELPAQKETVKPVGTNNPLAKILAKEKLKKQKTLEQLQFEAAEAFDNEDYALAIAKFEAILKLEPNFVEAKELLSICQSRLEVQKAESERKLREAEIELNRREAEVERKQREAEAERKRREQQLFLETLNRREEEVERKQREIEAEQIRREQLRLEKECIIQEAEEQRKAEEAKHDLSVPGTDAGERKTFTVKGVEFAFRWCPDTITKGTLRQKNLQTKGFWMMETQVTQDQWAAVMGYNPSHFKGGNRPVEQVSWRECQVFCDKCKWLGLPVQLPTEAQWEYACLAGSPGEYAGILNEMAWYNSNSGRKTHPVQMKTPNAWGVYDMHGNVWEWCQDEQKQYGSQPYRGGSWGSAAKDCRSSSRRSRDSEDRDFTLGFRCVKNL